MAGDALWMVSARPVHRPSAASSIEDLVFEGSGCIWDEHRMKFVNMSGLLHVMSRNCITFRWTQLDASHLTGSITYHRLVEDLESVAAV